MPEAVENVENALGVNLVLNMLPLLVILIIITVLIFTITSVTKGVFPTTPRLSRPNAKGLMIRLGRLIRRK